MADSDEWMRSAAANVEELMARAAQWAQDAYARPATVTMTVAFEQAVAWERVKGAEARVRAALAEGEMAGYCWNAGAPSVTAVPQRGPARRAVSVPWPLEAHASDGAYLLVALPVLGGSHPAGTTDDEWAALGAVLGALGPPSGPGQACAVFAQHSEDGNVVAAELAEDLPSWLTGGHASDDVRLAVRGDGAVWLVPSPGGKPSLPSAAPLSLEQAAAAVLSSGEAAGSSTCRPSAHHSVALSRLLAERLAARSAAALEGQHRALLVLPRRVAAALTAGPPQVAAAAAHAFLDADTAELRRVTRSADGAPWRGARAAAPAGASAGGAAGGSRSLGEGSTGDVCAVRVALPRSLFAAVASHRWTAPRSWAVWRRAAAEEAARRTAAGAAEAASRLSQALEAGLRLSAGLGLLLMGGGSGAARSTAASPAVAGAPGEAAAAMGGAGASGLDGGGGSASGAAHGAALAAQAMAAAEAGSAALAEQEEGRVAGLEEAEAAPGAGRDGFLGDAAAAFKRMAEVQQGRSGASGGARAAAGGASDAVKGVLERVPEFVDTLGRLEGVDLPGDDQGDGGDDETDDEAGAAEDAAGGDSDVDAWASWIEGGGPPPKTRSAGGALAAEEMVWPHPLTAGVRASDEALWALMELAPPVSLAKSGDGPDWESQAAFGEEEQEDDDDLAEAMQAELDRTTMKESLDEVDLGDGQRARSAEATLVGSMARSVGAQAGQSGPASSLLGQLGVPQPEEWLAGMAD